MNYNNKSLLNLLIFFTRLPKNTLLFLVHSVDFSNEAVQFMSQLRYLILFELQRLLKPRILLIDLSITQAYHFSIFYNALVLKLLLNEQPLEPLHNLLLLLPQIIVVFLLLFVQVLQMVPLFQVSLEFLDLQEVVLVGLLDRVSLVLQPLELPIELFFPPLVVQDRVLRPRCLRVEFFSQRLIYKSNRDDSLFGAPGTSG